MSVWNIILIALIVIYLGVCAFFYSYQESFLFHPRKTAVDYQYDFDYPFEEKFYQTPNNGNIHTLKFSAPESKGLVYYLHGNAGSLRDWGWVYVEFVKKGYDIVIVDYRGYGKSTGKLSESNMHNDVAFIYEDLKKEYKEEDIVIFGRSIGTGMATNLAAKSNAKALVLESPYYSVADIAKKVAPIFPLNILLKYKFESFKWVQDISIPIYIIHGDNDNVVPYDSGKKLYEVRPDVIQFYMIEGGQHNNLSQFPIFQQLLSDVLD